METFNEEYRLKEKGAVLNWFDIDAPEGRLSLNSKMSEILATFRGKLAMAAIIKKVMVAMNGNKKKGDKKKGAGFELNEDIMKMMGGFTLLRMTSMIGMMNVTFTKEELLKLNKKLNKIKVKK